ncbi:hypothetical protein E2C01_051357 [Portunus trituberculatus]|uniref:Regulatory protein zeste n=1 Tax=Portunus trituberculatus TaxID=210409 RepID=A0A5B7GK35_PORTR|nr:hypothetical protein [Portunus trituberculatus]
MTSSPLAKLLLPKFSISEMLCIIDQMKVFLPVFEGKLDVSPEKKEEAWQEVTRVVNLIFGGGRTPREIRLKYEDMQAQCMANYPRHLLHMRDTNGGYPQDIKDITIMEVEEALLEFLSPSGATGLHIRNIHTYILKIYMRTIVGRLKIS